MEGAVAPRALADAPDGEETIVVSERAESGGVGAVITSLFGPAPKLSTIVLHVSTAADFEAAERLARELQADDVSILVKVSDARGQRPAGYAYYDGRQSRAAADTVARLHAAARAAQIAAWSAQLRGTALPAREEYTADRLDIVLPPLPPPPAPPVATVPATTSAAIPQP
jgi:hypothetical protein